jgi:kinesin family member 5
VKFDDK